MLFVLDFIILFVLKVFISGWKFYFKKILLYRDFMMKDLIKILVNYEWIFKVIWNFISNLIGKICLKNWVFIYMRF